MKVHAGQVTEAAAVGPAPGHRTRRRALIVPVAAAALLLGGCRESPRELAFDLVADADLARQLHSGGVRSYVAPPVTVYGARPRARRAGTPPRLVSSAILEWSERLPRDVGLDIEPSGWGNGEVRLTLNRTPLRTLPLERGRESYTVPLPLKAQLDGLNRLRLSFTGETSSGPPPPAGPPARLHGVSVRSPGETGPARSVDVHSGPDGRSVLALAAGTGLEYALRLPEAAELRFTPRLAPGPTDPVHFRVELTVEGEPARDLFNLTLERGDEPAEVRVPLPGPAGHPTLVGLHVSAGPGAGAAMGEWVGPRVLDRGEPSAPEARESRAGLERLRRRLGRGGVLLVVLDAAAAGHFGCYGYERDTTPEIDRIAAEGFVFERAYSPASYTTLAMASLWTSQHPEQHHHGARLTGSLPDSRVVLPELLRERGIPAAAFVGNPNAGRVGGVARGFTEAWPLRLDSRASSDAPDPSSLERVETWVVGSGPGPHLTYLHYLEPHFPYDPPPPFDTRFGSEERLPPRAHRDPAWFKSVARGRLDPTAGEIAHLRRLYDGNLAAVDHEIGQLRRRLEAAGRWDDLLVIVTADHGETFLQHGELTHAGQVYEESVRIPLVIKLPGETRPARPREPVDLVDLGATLADVFGVASDAAGQLHGRTLLPLLAGESLAPRPVVARNALERPTYAFVDGGLKLIHEPRWGATELYDLEEDGDESRDLSEALPVTTELLRQSLYRWLRDLDRGAPATGSEPELSPEDEEALRALGYLD